MPDEIMNLAPAPAPNGTASELFMWRAGCILLLGEREDEHFILARSWLHGDCLAHVRRWRFAAPVPFSGQVRRLVMEACGDPALARDQGLRARDWAESLAG